VGGIGFLVIERWLSGRNPQGPVTWSVAVVVGIGQLIAAVFPGTSRSGATILLMLLFGLSRPAAIEFSFLVGIPTMLAAGGLKIFRALRHVTAGGPTEHWGMVALGFITSAVVSFIAVRWLLRYMQTHTFVVFGWYRIVLGALLFFLLFMQA
jgi:undecaprenyl-diphosphatase